MNGNSIAIDANIAVDVMNGVEPMVSIVRSISLVWVPVPVVAELHFGAINSTKVASNLSNLAKFLSESPILEVDRESAECYAALRLDMRRRGRMIPMNDIWIAAVCQRYQIPLLTRDRHFDEISQIDVIRP